jgi:hypothetical protein
MGVQVFGEQVHQQTILPFTGLRAALVGTHHADRLEANLSVATDGRRVVRERIDDDTMMSKIANEMDGERADGISTNSLMLPRLTDEDVDAGVTVLRFCFLGRLDETDHGSGEHDRVAGRP